MTDIVEKDSAALSAPSSNRLRSIDALRGFDMIWIAGGDYLVHLLALLTGWGVFEVFSTQLRHVELAGLHAYDLIFPLFMFLSGVSLVFSLAASKQKGLGSRDLIGKAGKRAVIFFLIGILYNFGWDVTWERFRLASVLAQIGFAYFLCVILFVSISSWVFRGLALIALLGLVAYLQLGFPVPGYGPGVITAEGSFNAWIDQNFLPARLYGVTYDPEGLLNIFSSVAVTGLGAFAGLALMQWKDNQPWRAVTVLIGAGALLTALGTLMHPYYPVIKVLWTVPFSLVSAGISMMLLALFFAVVDLMNFNRLGFVLSVIGVNSIGIYLGARFLASPIFVMSWPDGLLGTSWLSVGVVSFVMLLEWLTLYICYKRGWFLKF